MQRYLICGDPMAPACGDLIAEIASLPVGESVPDGWRVLTGNQRASQIGRIVLRCELESEPRFVVDGLEFDDEESALAGDGTFPPFRVFDVPAQDYVPGTFETRDAAQAVADYLN